MSSKFQQPVWITYSISSQTNTSSEAAQGVKPNQAVVDLELPSESLSRAQSKCLSELGAIATHTAPSSKRRTRKEQGKHAPFDSPGGSPILPFIEEDPPEVPSMRNLRDDRAALPRVSKELTPDARAFTTKL